MTSSGIIRYITTKNYRTTFTIFDIHNYIIINEKGQRRLSRHPYDYAYIMLYIKISCH